MAWFSNWSNCSGREFLDFWSKGHWFCLFSGFRFDELTRWTPKTLLVFILSGLRIGGLSQLAIAEVLRRCLCKLWNKIWFRVHCSNFTRAQRNFHGNTPQGNSIFIIRVLCARISPYYHQQLLFGGLSIFQSLSRVINNTKCLQLGDHTMVDC